MNDIQFQWLRKRATKLETCLPEFALSNEESAAVDRILENATVVGIGEVSHGAAEVFHVRDRLLRFLMRDRGFTVLIIEACFAGTLALNRYLLGGDGTAAETLAQTEYSSYVNKETLELITWIRKHNDAVRGNSRALRIFGCDLQSIDGPKAEISRMLSALRHVHITEEEYATATSLLGQLPSDRTVYGLVDPLLKELARETPDASRIAAIQSQRREFMTGVHATTRQLNNRCRDIEQRLRSRLQAEDSFIFDRCIRLIEQAIEFYFPDGLQKRDGFMVENVCAVIEFVRGEKCVLAAHNLHVARIPLSIRGEQFIPAGCILARSLTSDYKVIGSAYHHGSYLAAAGLRPDEDHVVVAHTPQANAWEFSLREFADAMRTPCFLLAIGNSNSRSDEFPWPSDIEMNLGEAGAPGDYRSTFVPQRPDMQYDGLVFITEITPITVLPEYYRRAQCKWGASL